MQLLTELTDNHSRLGLRWPDAAGQVAGGICEEVGEEARGLDANDGKYQENLLDP